MDAAYKASEVPFLHSWETFVPTYSLVTNASIDMVALRSDSVMSNYIPPQSHFFKRMCTTDSTIWVNYQCCAVMSQPISDPWKFQVTPSNKFLEPLLLSQFREYESPNTSHGSQLTLWLSSVTGLSEGFHFPEECDKFVLLLHNQCPWWAKVCHGAIKLRLEWPYGTKGVTAGTWSLKDAWSRTSKKSRVGPGSHVLVRGNQGNTVSHPNPLRKK